MKNEDRIYKDFRKIVKKKENEGYVDWKKSVISEVSELSKESLENMIKRYEIKLAMLDEKKEITGVQALTVALPLIVVTITVAVQCYSSVLGNMISAMNGLKNTIKDQTKFIGDIGKILNDGYAELLTSCWYGIVAILLLIAFVCGFTNYLYKVDTRRKIFYKELLLILNEQMVKL
jgi:hypothetical protein